MKTVNRESEAILLQTGQCVAVVELGPIDFDDLIEKLTEDKVYFQYEQGGRGFLNIGNVLFQRGTDA